MKKYTPICLILLLFFNCQSNDGYQQINMNGDWYVKNIKGGLTGTNETFEFGVLKLSFDSSNMSLTISKSNNITNSQEELFYREFGLENSNLTDSNYNISLIDGMKTLFINNIKIGNIEIKENSLLIDKGIDLDGLLIELVK